MPLSCEFGMQSAETMEINNNECDITKMSSAQMNFDHTAMALENTLKHRLAALEYAKEKAIGATDHELICLRWMIGSLH